MKKRLLMLAALGGLIAFVAKSSARRREEWHGLSEAEARAKLDERLPNRIPDDKREVITDRVVAKMRERGVIQDADEASTAASGAASSATGAGQGADGDGSIDLRDDETSTVTT